MTLQQVQYALTISETGSMNKAAEKLFVSQPTLTKALKELEKELGISVFRRTSRGVSETNEGTEFLIYARQLFQQYELLAQKYSAPGGVRRKFCVSAQHYSFVVNAFVETVKKFDFIKYEYAIRETRTYDVIHDVGSLRSEIGILYRNDFNRKLIDKMLAEEDIEFHELVKCDAYVYVWKNHPLAKEGRLTLEQLQPYPCLQFEQGENGSLFMAEELLSDREYEQVIKACDRATMLNLMVGLNGYTLCSGIICEELNGSDFMAIPLDDEELNSQVAMEIGYLIKKNAVLSSVGTAYIEEIRNYLNAWDERTDQA